MENSLIDVFGLCCNAILKESMNYSNTFFSEKHCLKDENRDTNFDLVENRLAYVYEFGYFNTILVQKCLEHFLDKYSAGKELFSGDLKVCSLSNGPGFDLLGFLCTIYKSFQNLKNLPVFTAINLYHSWWGISHQILSNVYQVAVESPNTSFNIPSEIIKFMQCDIYSTLSSDAKECIKDSDILLMVKAFASTKATSDVAKKCMKEIFSLLKTGSFVYFVGSKKNTKELTENNFQSKFVNCVLGPIKISVADLPINESTIVQTVNVVKPKTSGHVYFVVWQKKDSISLNTPEKSRGKKEEKKSTIQVHKGFIESIALSKQIHDCDESSDMSHSSSLRISLDSCSKSLNSALTTNQPTISLDNTPKKKKSRRKKKKSTKSTLQIQKEFIENPSVSKQPTDDTDAISETMSSFHSKQSKRFSNDSLSTLCEKKSHLNSTDEIDLSQLGKKKHNITLKKSLSLNSIAAIPFKPTTQVQKHFLESTAILKQTDSTNESSKTPYRSHSKQSRSLSKNFLSTSSERISESSFSVEIHSPQLEKKEHDLTLKKSLSLNSITALPFKATIQVQKEFIESTAFLKQADNTDDSTDNKQSRSLSNDFLSISSGKISESSSPVEIYSPHLKKEKHNITLKKSLSVNSITALLNEVHLDSEIGNLTAINNNKSGKESISIPEKNSYAKELESLVKGEVIIQNQNHNDLLNEKTVLNRVPYKQESELIQSYFCEKANKETLLTHYMNENQNVIQKCAVPVEENSVLILNNSDVPVNSFSEKESVKVAQFNAMVSSNVIPKLKKNVQVNKSETSVLTQTDSCLLSNFQKKISSKTAEQNIGHLDLKESNNCNLSSRENSKTNLREKVLRTVIQNRYDKNSFLDLSSKSKSKMPEDKSHENSLDLKRDVLKERNPEIDKNKDLNLFLQRCENLVTSLEKLTDNIKNSISSSSDQDTRYYCKKSCTEFKIQHAYMNSCCFNSVHSHCCIACNCHMFPHTSTYRNHFCDRAKQK